MTRAVQIAELGDQNVFTIDGDNTRVGIGSTQPTVKFDVGGDANVSGTLTATAFVGDGTGLTGVASTDNIVTGTAATFNNNVNISGITTVGVLTATQVNVTGVSTFVGFVAFTTSISVGGTVTYEDVTNIDSVGVVTARSGIEFGVSGVGGTVTATGQAEFVGVVTATKFVGDGSELTGVISGVEVEFGGNSVGTAVTNINFVGFSSVTAPAAGLSTVTAPSVAKSSAIANFIGG